MKNFSGTRKKKVRLADVARLAKVSQPTASRVANASGSVNPVIQERVKRAAKRLGFELFRKRPRVVALLLSNREILHPYHSHVLTGAEAFCAERGYSILFLRFRYDASASWRKLDLPHALQRHDLVSGYILAGTTSANLLELLRHKRMPFAVLGDNVLGVWQPPECDVVWSDDIQGACDLTNYLINIGHRDIWFLGNLRLPWFQRRYQGYLAALNEAGCVPRASEFDVDSIQEMGYLATKTILSRGEKMTALFAGRDLAAEGAYRALRERGLRVPEDISVAGFTDIEAPVMHPPLTTVRQFPEMVGQRLAELILNRIADPDLPAQQITIPTQLIKRESCAPRP